MFKNEFQGGQFFEVFTVQGKDPLLNWKVSGGVRKVYDRLVKGFIYSLEGSGTTTKIQLPKDSKSALTLIQRYLILQLFVPSGQEFSVELGITDLQNNKRRLFLSTAHKDISPTPLHAKIPLTFLRKATWLNLCLDLVSLVGETWRGQTHKSLEAITLSANCKLRKIFTMKVQPPDDDPDLSSSQSSHEVEMIPRQLQLPTDVSQFTLVLTMAKVRSQDGGRKPPLQDGVGQSIIATDADLSSSAARSGQQYRIAFGSKVAVQTGSAKRSREVNVSRQFSRQFSKSKSDDALSVPGISPPPDDAKYGVSGGGDDVIDDVGNHYASTAAEQRSTGDRGSRSWTSGGMKDETPFVAPHPPAEASNERARRRIRVKSAGGDRMAARFQASNQNPVVDQSSSGNVLPPVKSTEPTQSPSRLHNNDNHDNVAVVVAESGRHPGYPREDVVDIRPSPHVPAELLIPASPDPLNTTDEPLLGNGCHDDDTASNFHGNESSRRGTDDSINEIIAVLRDQVKMIEGSSSDDDEGGGDDNIRNSYEDSDEEPSSGRNVYMYHSPPKLPARSDPHDHAHKHSRKPTIVRHLATSSSRGAAPADDFRSSVSEDDDVVAGDRAYTDDKGADLVTMSRIKKSIHSPKKSVPSLLSPGGHISRMSISRRSLREIPQNDVRLTQLIHAHQPYDSAKYSDLNDTDALEARMLASLHREAQTNGSEADDVVGVAGHQNLEKHVYGHDTSSSDEDTTSFSTWKSPVPNLLSHHYRDEMQLPSSRTSQDTLGSSNPRDWTGVFSPPIVLPGDVDMDQSDRSDDSSKDQSHGVQQPSVNGQPVEQGSEDELDLLYDQCLNCYFDPKSCRYYELV